MSYNSSLSASALLWSMAGLNGSGGGGGTPGKDGTSWYVISEPLDDGFSAPLGSQKNDLILDSSGEIFRVIDDGSGNLVLESTGVTLTPTLESKSLYELYLDLNPSQVLAENDFKTRFLEALEEDEDFNLFEFYKTSGGLKYTTETDFVEQFVKVMDLDVDSLVTDRIVSKDGKVSVIAGNDGIKIVANNMNAEVSATIDVQAKSVLLEAEEVSINSTKNTTDGSTKITNVIDPENDLDVVNKRTLDSNIKTVTDSLTNLTTEVNTLKDKHTQDITEINDLISALNTKVDNLEKKHDEDMQTLQNNLVTYLSGYLQDELPKLVQAEVEQYIKDHPIDGGCTCEDPDIIDGGDAGTGVAETILVFDNGGATSSDFEYTMMDDEDSSATGDDKVIFGGDSDPSDDGTFISFEDWIKTNNLTNVWNGGTAEQKEEIMNTYIVWQGGSATSGY